MYPAGASVPSEEVKSYVKPAAVIAFTHLGVYVYVIQLYLWHSY